MNVWSNNSRKMLNQCAPELQLLFNRVLTVHDCAVVTGFRSREEQEAAFAAGLTQLHWPYGKHNGFPSEAIDVIPCIEGIGRITGAAATASRDLKYFYHFAGIVRGTAAALAIPIRWGGDWDGDFNLDDQSFNDLYHYELLEG